MRNTIAAAIAALSILAPAALHRRVIDPASPRLVQWIGRRLGNSAKSPRANRAQRRRRLEPARGIGSYMHADRLISRGLAQGVSAPSRIVRREHREWLAAQKASA